MDRRVLDLWVGIFVVAGIGALFVLALQVSNASTFNTSESYRVIAEFDNIGGLKARAPVKSAGVLVGRVESIGFDNDKFVARVVLRLDQRYTFPKDTIAREPDRRRQAQAHAVGGGAGEADRPVPLRPRGGRRIEVTAGRSNQTCNHR
jgi:hypothetical protein